MTDLDQLRRVAKLGVLLAIVVAVLGNVVALAAFGGDFEALIFRPERILGRGGDAALLWRWTMLLDMFYSYLLLLPLALFIHRRLRDREPWLADLGLVGGLAYILIGAASAAMLANAGSSLIEAYAAADAADQAAIAVRFEFMRDLLYFGVWQTLDPITAGTWVLSTGWLLLSDRPLLGRLLVATGAGFWVLAFMTMLDIHSLLALAVIVLVTFAAWIGWVLVDRPRRDSTNGRSMTPDV